MAAFFERLLKPPVEGAVGQSNAAVDSRYSDKWCSEVVSEYARSIAGHYPFDRDGHDLTLADFINFYKPKQGKLWTLVDGQLSAIVSLDGSHYMFSRRNGEEGSARYAQSLLDYLDRSRDISESFFPSGTGVDEPKLEFEVKVHPARRWR